jgi:hypothetical protein
LAKYYEHQLKDYLRAKLVVEEAIEQLNKAVINVDLKNKRHHQLQYRLKRIHRKMTGNQ